MKPEKQPCNPPFGYLCFMRFLRTVFHWYIKASLHVSLALVCLVSFSERVLGVGIPGHYYLALFFGSVAAYNAIKYGLEPRKHSAVVPGGFRLLVFFSLGSLLLGLYHLSFLPAHVWWGFASCGILAGMYALPVLPGFRNLRSIGLLKVFVVALVWTLASLWIPVRGTMDAGNWDFQVEGFQRMLWVLLLMLPFEVRDMEVDPPSLRTIPQRWGVRGTRRLAWVAALLFVSASWLKDSPAQGEMLCKAITGVVMGLAVAGATRDRGWYYAAFWVEGIPMLALLLLVFLGG